MLGARRIVGSVGVVVLAGGALGFASEAKLRATAPKLTSHETGIKYTNKTILVSKRTVTKNLIGVSAKGVFKFKHAAGPLAKLKPGKVMLLQGSDAVVVMKVRHSHGRLLVYTKSASLPQVIKSGKIRFSGAPNFRDAFVAPTVTSSRFTAAGDFQAPMYPYVGAPPGSRSARDAGFTFSVQGSAASLPFGYSLSFTPSASRLDVSGTICFQWGSICSNGPSNGLALEANLSGYIDVGSDSAAISVNGGRITHSSFGLHDLHAHLKLTYTGARGTGPDSGGDPPVFHLPVGIDYTIPGAIPIYLKVQTAILIKLGMSSKNTVLRGGVEYNSSGSDSIVQNGSNVTESGSGNGPKGNFLDSSDGGTGPSVALGAGGVVVAVQFPKLGVGLGVRALNGIGYLDMITSIGGTDAGAVAGGGCTYNLAWSEGGGFEAQAGPFGLSTPRKILIPRNGKEFERKFSAPGC